MTTSVGFEYECLQCGEIHVGLPSFSFAEPQALASLLPDDRNKLALLGSDNCIINGRWFFQRTLFFILGNLKVPINGHQEQFSWLVWVSLSKQNYNIWENLYETERRSHADPMFGWLNSALPIYQNTLNLPVTVTLNDNFLRPTIELQQVDHKLFHDQKKGIRKSEAEKLVGTLLECR